MAPILLLFTNLNIFEFDLTGDFHLSFKFNIKLVFLDRALLSSSNQKTIVQLNFMPVLVYGDILYCPAAPSTLQLLNSLCHSALDFITNNKFDTQHCSLYYREWLDGLHYNQEETALSLFTYKALLSNLPNYFTSLLSLEFNNCSTQFRNYLT